jgi:hypothetical protein
MELMCHVTGGIYFIGGKLNKIPQKTRFVLQHKKMKYLPRKLIYSSETHIATVTTNSKRYLDQTMKELSQNGTKFQTEIEDFHQKEMTLNVSESYESIKILKKYIDESYEKQSVKIQKNFEENERNWKEVEMLNQQGTFIQINVLDLKNFDIGLDHMNDKCSTRMKDDYTTFCARLSENSRGKQNQ